jgi:enoyl-CoA hydratase/carnithine racemase
VLRAERGRLGAVTEPVVLFEVQDRVATITLNRPEARNAFSRALGYALWDAVAAAGDDAAVDAVVITGTDPAFSAGVDLKEVSGEVAPSAEERGPGEGPERFDDNGLYRFIPLIPKPVIGAINGACAGLGLVHAVMCDVRFAAAGAKFTTAFVRRGLVAEHGISWLLPRLVGPAAALDLLLSGRIVLAEEAAEIGLVNRVLPPEEVLPQAIAYAHELATWSSPKAMATIKQQVYRDLDASLPDALASTKEAMAESFTWPDLGEGVASFLEKREPQFEPLGS